MKRLLLPAIILFPVIMLLVWVYLGWKQPRTAPPQPAANTNLNASP